MVPKYKFWNDVIYEWSLSTSSEMFPGHCRMGPGLDQDVSWRTRQADNFTSKLTYFILSGYTLQEIEGGGGSGRGGRSLLQNEVASNVK